MASHDAPPSPCPLSYPTPPSVPLGAPKVLYIRAGRSKFIFFLKINMHAAKVNLTLGRAKPTFFTRWTRPLCLFRILGRPCRPARLLATGWGQAANNVTSGADQQARKTRPENNWKNETKRKQKNRTENYCKSEAILVPRIYRVFLAVHSLQVQSNVSRVEAHFFCQENFAIRAA